MVTHVMNPVCGSRSFSPLLYYAGAPLPFPKPLSPPLAISRRLLVLPPLLQPLPQEHQSRGGAPVVVFNAVQIIPPTLLLPARCFLLSRRRRSPPPPRPFNVRGMEATVRIDSLESPDTLRPLEWR